MPSYKKPKNKSYLVKPVISPVVSSPVAPQPVVSSPMVSQQVVSQPVVSSPVVSQPVVSSPTSALAHPESHSAPGDSSGPLYSAYILIFFALFYIGLASAFINRYGQADCKISDSKKNVIRGLSWIMIGISIFFILFGVAEAKGFIIKIWFTPKWIHMLSFIYHFIMFMLSIFLYVMFNHNDTSNEDFLLCDDFRDNDKNIIEGSIHSTINIVLDILMISSIVMSLISVIYHMMKDTN